MLDNSTLVRPLHAISSYLNPFSWSLLPLLLSPPAFSMSRLSEKPRVSTCPFASSVASLSLPHFPPCSTQRCLSAIILHHPSTGLKVVSIGEGTKFLPSSTPSTLTDMHAEVLSLRGFKRYLWSQLSHLPLKERYALPPDTTVHMYTSSAPCGDATVRRWSKGSAGFTTDEHGWFDGGGGDHGALNGQAVGQGQFSLLLKGGGGATPEGYFPAPAGTSYCGLQRSEAGMLRSHTCSDKMLLASHLGLQGTLLTSHLSHKIHLASLTVGRKYSAVGCKRAVCCRSGGFRSTKTCRKAERGKEKWTGAVNHPVIMCTGVKADESKTEEGARFSSACRVGWLGGESVRGAKRRAEKVRTLKIDVIANTSVRNVAAANFSVVSNSMCAHSLTTRFALRRRRGDGR